MRKITIYSSKDQTAYTVYSDATTLGEVIDKFKNETSIDFTNMTLYEGHARAEYNPEDADAILPHDIPYEGNIINDLLFRMTVSQKKIKSGVITRAEVYNYFKSNPEAASLYKETYGNGKSFTNAKTADLIEFINNNSKNTNNNMKKSKKDVTNTEAIDVDIRKVLKTLIEILYENEYLDDSDYVSLHNSIKLPMKEEGEPCPYSNEEIEAMFAGV